MRWYNFDTGVLDTVETLPDTLDGWEPYIPILRRTEFWLRTNLPETVAKNVALDILAHENNKTLPPSDILPVALAHPA